MPSIAIPETRIHVDKRAKIKAFDLSFFLSRYLATGSLPITVLAH